MKISSDFYSLIDHANGFDSSFHNQFLDSISDQSITLCTEYVSDTKLRSIYPNFRWKFDLEFKRNLFCHVKDYTIHPAIAYKNFICCFNGRPHVSRKLLTAALSKWGWFDPATCSKNFQLSASEIDDHIRYYAGNREGFYSKFFAGSDDQDFLNTVYNLAYLPNDISQDIHKLETILTKSFVHIVSETMAETHYPFVTEKFLYSVVTRGLFMAYAQPGWHAHLEKYFGFRRYERIFDYRFDAISNPVDRLIELMSMLAKFSVLNVDDWRDLYEMESDTIEYNYDHYFSQRYLDCLGRLQDV